MSAKRAGHREKLWCVVRFDGVDRWFVLQTFAWWRWQAIDAYVGGSASPADRRERWEKAKREDGELRAVKVNAEEVRRGAR